MKLLERMRIGIDISQIVYEGTGVGNYVREMVRALLTIDKINEYILFGASLRQRRKLTEFFEICNKSIPGIKESPTAGIDRVRLVALPIPPTILEFLWNRLHWFPIELFTGPLAVFWSSDWTQPPLKNARGITTIHDLTVLKYPESFEGTNIVEVQKRRLTWAKKECIHFLSDSVATANDAKKLLGIENITVVYPGI